MARYLSYHVNKLEGAHAFIPQFLLGIVKALAWGSRMSTAKFASAIFQCCSSRNDLSHGL